MDEQALKEALEHDVAIKAAQAAPSTPTGLQECEHSQAVLAAGVAAMLLATANRVAQSMMATTDSEDVLILTKVVADILRQVNAADMIVDRMVARVPAGRGAV